MSESPSVTDPEPTGHMPPPGAKRTSDQAGLQSGARAAKAVKRRASKACQSCRQRKVRCNVVEEVPCTNCRLDSVPCLLSESKRKKYRTPKTQTRDRADSGRKWTAPKNGEENGQDSSQVESPTFETFPAEALEHRGSEAPFPPSVVSEHRPHSLYNDLNAPIVDIRPRAFSNGMHLPAKGPNGTSAHSPSYSAPRQISPPLPSRHLPAYIKPLPARIGADEVLYLSRKGALTIPHLPLRNALLKCFIEYVYPYMPLVEIKDLIETVDRNDGSSQISLLVFQAIMFSGIAMVDIKQLNAAGYTTRREARREFFQKTRLLYDFDYEQDRISLIQALLLMTYWYETPDDQKDSHHWMGIAVSLSHTIGLHRNSERSGMELKQRQLWRRIWWSTYMRDRLIALGMRRPTRIKNEDFNVPLLSLEDFSFTELSRSTLSCITPSCKVMYSADLQRRLAIMCVEKSKLCICISHVLSTQYSVLHNNLGAVSKEGTTRTTMMLVAKKDDPGVCGVKECDEELRKWKESINSEADVAEAAQQTLNPGEESFFLNRSLLHMVYHSTLSALHRPQVLPASTWPSDNTSTELLEMSRANVRHAANQITIYADVLSKYNLIRFLPTVGITVLLPAIIIHLLDIKAPDEQTRRTALQGFCQCMQIMSQLRDVYAAADYSTAFLEAAIRKAEIALPRKAADARDAAMSRSPGDQLPAVTLKQNIDPALMGELSGDHLTPPPDAAQAGRLQHRISDAEVASRLNSYLTVTPPESNELGSGEHDDFGHHDSDMLGMADFEPDFDALVNLDAAGEAFALDDAEFRSIMPGTDTGAGFMSSDVNWMKGLSGDLNPTMA